MAPSCYTFDPFDLVQTHELMLRDEARTDAYRRAIAAQIKADDVVLDLGCGSGILSMFAALTDCKKIYAVDKSSILQLARDTARLNGVADRIEFVNKDVFEFEPPEPIDIVIHEQIGFYIWDEDLASKLDHVRAFLKPNGRMIPDSLDVYAVPTSHQSPLHRSIEFWEKEHFGFSFEPFLSAAMRQGIPGSQGPSRIVLPTAETFLSRPQILSTMNFSRGTSTAIPAELTGAFSGIDGRSLRGMCIYFSAQIGAGIVLSTGPKGITTCWGQVLLPYFNCGKPCDGSVALLFSLFPELHPHDWRYEFDVKGSTEQNSSYHHLFTGHPRSGASKRAIQGSS